MSGINRIAYPVSFNNLDLSSSVTGLQVLSTNPYMPTKRDVVANEINRTDKQVISSAFYKDKKIIVKCAIGRDNRNQVEQSFDSLMSILQGKEKDLVFTQSGINRKYTATLSDVNILKSGGMMMEFELVFECSNAFGQDVGTTLALTWTGVTGQPRTDSMTIGGSAPWQSPTITITYTVLTGGTSGTVVIGNGSTGQQITITRDWVAGDVLIIDTEAKSVKVNGTEVAFTGALPEFESGTGLQYITYSDTFTTRTYSGSVRYYKKYV